MSNSPEEIRSALAHVPPCDRDQWVRMGMALKSELGDVGFEIWDGWSQQDESYRERDARDVWRSIKAGGKVSIGTVFYEAKRHGWRPSAPLEVPSPADVAERQRQATERAEAEERQRASAQEAARAKAERILADTAGDAASHAYAQRKALAFGPLVKRGEWTQRGWSDALLVPIFAEDGRCWSIEAIDPSGAKDSLSGGRKSGGFFPFGKLRGAERIVIGEGVATTAAGHEATGWPAAAALSAGNMRKVAEAMRRLSPEAEIYVVGDAGQAGEKAARDAAEAVGAKLVQIKEGDLWDYWNTHGKEKTRELFVGAEALASPGVVLLRGDEIKPEPIEWLWPGWLATGKLHVLAGAPGTGKTTLALALIASITTGGRWPDGSKAPRGSALVWTGEDDPKDTLVPRLMAMGADMSRVHFVTGVRASGGAVVPFDPANHMAHLDAKARQIGGVRLLMVDPVVSAVAGDSHKNTEVRRALQPLVDFGIQRQCAVLGISHFSKGTAGRDPTERVTGSIAFGAVARVVLAAAKVKDDDGTERRIIVRSKSNIGLDSGGFNYSLEQAEVQPGIVASRVVWGAAIEGEARELLAESGDDQESRGALADATEWLADFLADGPKGQPDVMHHAGAHGITRKTIRNAKDRLGVRSEKGSLRSGWSWSLPEGAHDSPKVPIKIEGAPSGLEGHLRAEPDLEEGDL